MRFRTWLVAAVALVGLLALTATYGVITTRRSAESFEGLDTLFRHYRDVEVRLHRLRSDVHLSGIFIRDYLLDTTGAREADYRRQLTAYRQSNLTALDHLSELIPDEGSTRDRFQTLQASLDEYWRTFDPVFAWTPAERTSLGTEFLRREVVPRREGVLAIAREIEDLTSASMQEENRQATSQYAVHLGDMRTLLWQTLALGVVVTAISIHRFRALERRAAEQRLLAEAAGERARVLSQQVVATQEEERRKLSRELHDHVGQMLTGLRMQLGRIERLGSDERQLGAAVADSRSLVDRIMHTVRDLALGLRPSMLDDFGLQPALEWLVRDVSRRSNLQATTEITLSLDRLPESHRTCVFRAVQEALTNCARHSGATTVSVTVTGDDTGLTVAVRDNGVGIDSERLSEGLGLRGLRERAKELGGTATIDTGFGAGTTVRLWLPVPPVTEENDASITG